MDGRRPRERVPHRVCDDLQQRELCATQIAKDELREASQGPEGECKGKGGAEVIGLGGEMEA